MLTITTRNPADTFAFGQRLGGRLAVGDVVCLSGDLGAGKTVLVQGVAAGLGITDQVTSPTFTILQVYETGRLPLYHFDLYRLENSAELDNIGFEEYIGSDGAAVIEWADKFVADMPEERLWIELRGSGDASGRALCLTPEGERYRLLCAELEEKC
jgi:ATPase, YjeE family